MHKVDAKTYPLENTAHPRVNTIIPTRNKLLAVQQAKIFAKETRGKIQRTSVRPGAKKMFQLLLAKKEYQKPPND